MKFEQNKGPTDLKMVAPNGDVVGYAFRSDDGFWHATTADQCLIRVPNSGFRDGKGYEGPDAAGSAIIAYVTKGRGI